MRKTFLLFFLGLIWFSVEAISTPKSPALGTDLLSNAQTWSMNVGSCNSGPNCFNFGTGGISVALAVNNLRSSDVKLSNFGFPVAATDIMTGFQITIQRIRTNGPGSTCWTEFVQLDLNGSLLGIQTSQSASVSNVAVSNVTFGSSTDLLGTTGLTGANVSDSQFGVVYSINRGNSCNNPTTSATVTVSGILVTATFFSSTTGTTAVVTTGTTALLTTGTTGTTAVITTGTTGTTAVVTTGTTAAAPVPTTGTTAVRTVTTGTTAVKSTTGTTAVRTVTTGTTAVIGGTTAAVAPPVSSSTESTAVGVPPPDGVATAPPPSVAPIIGAVVGAILLLAVIGIIVAVVIYRRRNAKDYKRQDSQIQGAALPVIVIDPSKDAMGSFEKMLIQDPFKFVKALTKNVDVTETDMLTAELIVIFQTHDKCITLIERLISREVKQANHAGSLMRANSIASKSMKAFSGLIGKPLLQKVLGPIIESICKDPLEDGASFEVSPEKVPEGQTLAKNQEKLEKFCSKFLRTIFDSIDDLPTELRQVCHYLQKTVSKKFPASAQSCVGGFLFLRYFCPAIVTPVAFGVIKQQPNQDAQRGLTLIAKALQNIANNQTFGNKEEYLEFLNNFVTENLLSIQDYFDQVCVVPSQFAKPAVHVKIDDFKKEKALKNVWKVAKNTHPKLLKKEAYQKEQWMQDLTRMVEEVSPDSPLNRGASSTNLRRDSTTSVGGGSFVQIGAQNGSSNIQLVKTEKSEV